MRLGVFLAVLFLAGFDRGFTEANDGFTVDRYGQNARVDFPGKITSDDELKADLAEQKALSAPSSGRALDTYGGLAGSGAEFGLKKSGFFRIDKIGDRQVLVTPEGNLFFHLGVCGISNSDDYTLVKGRESVYEWLPPREGTYATAWRANTSGVVSFYIANWIRKFGRPFSFDDWTGQVVDRLRAWGFNSAGAFSTYTGPMRSRQFPYVSWLPSGREFGAKMLPDKVGASELLDPFAPGTEEALRKAFAQKVTPLASDPLIIGFFNGNEQHFELLPKMIPAYKASQVAAKGRLVDFLREKYRTIEDFDQAWHSKNASTSFEGLGENALTVLTEEAAADMKEFTRLYLETYFSMIERVFREADPNHLLIGNRLTPGTANNRDVVEISGAHIDVLSINYYSYAIEKEYLEQTHRWSGGKPIILSEWYFSSTDSGLGAGKEVQGQKERGLGYRHYVEQAASLPFIVGSEWFIYNDQAITGRFFEGLNGEGNNTGLVDVGDRPYEELVAATRLTGSRIYDVVLGREAPFVFQDPRFVGGQGSRKVVTIPRALPNFKMDGSTTNWPGRPAEPIESSRLVLGNPNSSLRGDFRLCWDDANLYFLIQVKDPTPAKNDQPVSYLWNGDGVELFLSAKDIDTGGSMAFGDLQILLGAGEAPKVHIDGRADDAMSCRLLVIKDVSGDGYVLEAAIPWSVLKTTPRAGMMLLFDVGIDNSDDGKVRKQQLMWNGTAKNSGDRGGWGRARLVEN